MIKMFKNIRVLKLKNFRNYCALNNSEVIALKTEMETEVVLEEKIRTIIAMKIKKYQELMVTQSPEKEEVCKQIKIIESRLRKLYRFDKDEDLNVFPVFKFDEPKIDNQIDYNKTPK